jgi:hypothetical protein
MTPDVDAVEPAGGAARPPLADTLRVAGGLAGARAAFEHVLACRPRLSLPTASRAWLHLVPVDDDDPPADASVARYVTAPAHGRVDVRGPERLCAIFDGAAGGSDCVALDVPAALVPALGPRLDRTGCAAEPKGIVLRAELAISVGGTTHAVRTGTCLASTLAGWCGLLGAADWTLDAPPTGTGATAARVELVVDRMRLQPGELDQLAVGDLLLPALDAFADGGAIRAVGANLDLPATWRVEPDVGPVRVELGMPDADRVPAADSMPAGDPRGEQEHALLSEPLDIVLGEASVDLRAVHEGALAGAPLDVTHDHPYVRLVSARRVVGVGEIVELDHGLAVEVLRVEARA